MIHPGTGASFLNFLPTDYIENKKAANLLPFIEVKIDYLM